MIQLEPLMGIEDVCKELGINKYTLFHRIRKNTFPKGVKIMGKRKLKMTAEGLLKIDFRLAFAMASIATT